MREKKNYLNSERFKGCLNSKDTYNLLNYLTLDIKDPEIQRKFDDQRCQNFKSLFLPMLVFYILCLIVTLPFRWRNFFTGKAAIDYVQMGNFIVWTVLNYCFPKYAPLCTILTQLSYGMLFFVRFDDYQGETDSRFIELLLLQVVLFLLGINYNSFKMNVFLLSPAIIFPSILIDREAAGRYDLETYEWTSRSIFKVLIVIAI